MTLFLIIAYIVAILLSPILLPLLIIAAIIGACRSKTPEDQNQEESRLLYNKVIGMFEIVLARLKERMAQDELIS